MSPLHLAPLFHLALVGVPSLQCTLRYPGSKVPGWYPSTWVPGLSSTDNNAPFFHPALVGPRPGEVRQGEPLRDRAKEEEQDVRLHHRTLRHGAHLQRTRQKTRQTDHPKVTADHHHHYVTNNEDDDENFCSFAYFRMAVAHIKSLRGITNTPPNDGTFSFLDCDYHDHLDRHHQCYHNL